MRTAWTGAPLVAASGFGWTVCANEDAAWWEASDGRRAVLLRHPEAEPFQPGAIICAPTGGHVDLGRVVASRTGARPAPPGARVWLGHTPVVRRRHGLWDLDGLPVDLPESATQAGARPWPARPGWAWVDHDTVYRKSPDGRITVAARVPAAIGAWDVGPHGALWFVAAGCLWLAPPMGFARRAAPEVEEALGVPVASLHGGSVVFADDGRSLAALETPGAHRICLGRRPYPGAEVGSVIGLSPHPVGFPEPTSPALSCVARSVMVRVTRHSLVRMDGAGLVGEHRLELPGRPLGVGAGDDGRITMLVGGGFCAVDVDGRAAEPRPEDLALDAGQLRLVATPRGRVWAGPGGAMVPLSHPSVVGLV